MKLVLHPTRFPLEKALVSPGDPRAFHRKLPGYWPTPLGESPALAAACGVSRVFLKVEAARLGLPAFKILGASWATFQTLASRLETPLRPWSSLEELVPQFAPLRPLTLVTATDGNHGRAVARVARWFQLGARIFVPQGTVRARIEAIAGEGAEVIVVDGHYDDAVRAAAAEEGPGTLVVSDTSWPGYTDIPRRVIEGYRTIFEEVEEELASRGEPLPDLVLIQSGVGALAAAAASFFRSPGPPSSIRLVSIEPVSAACLLASAEAGRIASVPGPHTSIMVGLNCGTPSLAAWPLIDAGFDAFLAIEDDRVPQAMRLLAQEGVMAGETGASGSAGLLELTRGTASAEACSALCIGPSTRALVLVTEGPTDPESFRRLMG